MRRHLPVSVVCLAALLLALAGCGGGGGDKQAAKGKDGKPIVAAADFQAKRSLIAKGASAGGGEDGQDYEPTGKIIADSGFRPSVDGFAFENYGNDVEPQNLTPAEVEDLFGEQVCLSGTGTKCRLIPAGQKWMEDQNEGMAGGHCQGFSVTALRFYNENLDQEDYGADTTAALDVIGNVDLQATIAEDFTYQFLPPIVQKRIKGAPSRILRVLADALRTNKELYTLGVYKADLSGGHAITPFAIEDKGNGKYAIIVYDNNFPGQIRAVQVDKNRETWSYVSGTNPSDLGQVYKGSKRTETMELDPTLPVEEVYSPCPFCNATRAGKNTSDTKGTVLPKAQRYTEITLTGDPRNHPHLVFEDDDGRRTGVVGGQFLHEIPDVEVIKTYATQNWKGAPEPRFRLPEGKDYTITVDGSDLEKAAKPKINLVGNGLVIEVEDLVIEPGQQDVMTLPGGYGITYLTNTKDETGAAPNFYAGLVEGDAAYNFAASAVGVKPGSTISFLVEQENKVVILDSTGSEGILGGKGFFILQLTKADEQGRISQWQAGDVRLSGAKEEKVGFEYGESPQRGKPLPFLVLDKNGDTKRVINAKPE